MTLLELSTNLSGRYVSFRINFFHLKKLFTGNIKQINIFDFSMDGYSSVKALENK